MIVDYLMQRGFFVQKKGYSKRDSLYHFLCDRVGVSHFTTKKELFSQLFDVIEEPVFGE
ncbi:MAG: hypothetical protein JEZ14_24685 [Marinilabiliaceae bacterium]|nr:hypothetical protein [Marinilabiliaceae bacterium]